MAIDRSRSRPAAESNRRGASGAENRGALWPEHSGRSVLGSLVLLLAALFAVWLLLPAVTAERNPPQDAERLGRDLSRGFRSLPWSGLALQLMITLGLLVGGLLWTTGKFTPGGRANDALAVLIVGGLVFLFFAVCQAGAALRSVLDVALDVANWLRHDPPARTPAARICTRFASLLRFTASAP